MRILLAGANDASFIRRDVALLSRHHEVTYFDLRSATAPSFSAQLKLLRSTDLLLLWFASPRFLPLTAVARLRRIPVAVIIGGYEVASLPEFGYGSARSYPRSIPTRALLRLADAIAVVSDSSQNSLSNNLGIADSRVSRVYHGFADIAPDSPPPRKPSVVTIATVTRENWEIKGISDFLLVAEQLPATEFTLIGAVKDDVASLLGHAPAANVKFVGAVPYEQIGEYLSAATIYLQLSRHESFGCAVAEAMLCGCIPVVADAFALPEVVGQTGVILSNRDPKQVAASIRSLLAEPGDRGLSARRRILDCFSPETRLQGLEALVARALEGHR